MFNRFTKYFFLTLVTFLSTQLYGQDTTRTITEIVTDEGNVWYMQPWVWIAGGIALLLILIALFSGGKKKKTTNANSTRTDKVIITKTVRRETDTE